MSHIAVLRNPTAGRGRLGTAVTVALSELAGNGRTVELLRADSRDAALQACRKAVADGVDALVVAGGDGTVHMGVQAVAGTGVAFGILPSGTGNDFAQEIGVPADPVAAGRRIVQALEEGRTRPVDAARMAGPEGYDAWFAAVLAAGFDALVNERANRMRWPKGRRRYDIAMFAELATLRQRRYRIELDDQVIERDACLAAVGNTRSYGGGMLMCPDADPTDGLLDVVVAGPVNRRTLVGLFPKVFKGQHVAHPTVDVYRTRSVRIDADGIVGYADGERTCPLPMTVTAVPGALRVLI